MKTSRSFCSALIAASCGLSVLVLAPKADATNITVFTDKQAWIDALDEPWFETEDFEDQTLNPGVSVISTVGKIQGGVWSDLINDSPLQTTTWKFEQPEIWDGINAWGGIWDLAGPGGRGSNIAATVTLLMDGQQLIDKEIPNTLQGDFWGFVSDTPFDQVILTEGNLGGGHQETYTFDDMVYAQPAPEPSSILGIFVLGTLGAGSALKRKQK
ncbi:PEP-CTERM sorting domain-containing protein [Coleofasciculus sp. F4-SAH-05]|uniref:PEP-CTERM sorting domain-containing protein n=1 Tax=Coleofasciculus sp. F4-SAH-05 TaxID=3069525 RepID=UPI003304EDA5